MLFLNNLYHYFSDKYILHNNAKRILKYIKEKKNLTLIK